MKNLEPARLTAFVAAVMQAGGSDAQEAHTIARRLVQPGFAALAARKLAPGGVLHAATDWPDYAEQMQAVFSAVLEPAQRGLVERPVTKFEARGRRLGHPIQEFFFRRTS